MLGRGSRILIAILLVVGLAAGGATIWWRRGMRDSVLAEEIKTFAWLELTINTSMYNQGFDREAIEVKQVSANHGDKTFKATLRIHRAPLRLGMEGVSLEGQDGYYESQVTGEFAEQWIKDRIPLGIEISRPRVLCRKITFPEDPIAGAGPAAEARWKDGEVTSNELFDAWVNFARFNDEAEDMPRRVLCLFTLRHLRQQGKSEDASWLRESASFDEDPWKMWADLENERLNEGSKE